MDSSRWTSSLRRSAREALCSPPFSIVARTATGTCSWMSQRVTMVPKCSRMRLPSRARCAGRVLRCSPSQALSTRPRASIQAREQEAEGFVVGDFGARATAASAQSDLAALGLGEASGGAQHGVEVVGPAEKTHAHAGEHRGQRMEAVVAARVGHDAQRQQQRAHLARAHG